MVATLGGILLHIRIMSMLCQYDKSNITHLHEKDAPNVTRLGSSNPVRALYNVRNYVFPNHRTNSHINESSVLSSPVLPKSSAYRLVSTHGLPKSLDKASHEN